MTPDTLELWSPCLIVLLPVLAFWVFVSIDILMFAVLKMQEQNASKREMIYLMWAFLTFAGSGLWLLIQLYWCLVYATARL